MLIQLLSVIDRYQILYINFHRSYKNYGVLDREDYSGYHLQSILVFYFLFISFLFYGKFLIYFQILK